MMSSGKATSWIVGKIYRRFG